jgi:hypothetical protein
MRTATLLTSILLFATLLVVASSRQTGLIYQTQDEAARKNGGCISAGCHVNTEPMHVSPAVRLGCTDCHGGNAETRDRTLAHVLPADTTAFPTSANGIRPYTAWLKERAEYVRFVNPGDLRIAQETCVSSGCHVETTAKVRKSMMTHGGMLWGAALYNNGSYPLKDTHFGESYSRDGLPQRIYTVPPPASEQTAKKGVLTFLDPLRSTDRMGSVATGQYPPRLRARRDACF